MAFCSKCGNQLAEGTKFCGACGQTLAATPAASAPIANLDPTKPIATLSDGFSGRINLFDDRAELSSKQGGLFSNSSNTRTYFYPDITSVEFQPPTAMKPGYLRFLTAGTIRGASGTSAFSMNKHITNDVDTLTLPFGKSRIDEYKKFYDFLMWKIRESKQPRGGTTVVNQQASAADELLKYKQLLDAGVLTQEEFDAKKRQLMG